MKIEKLTENKIRIIMNIDELAKEDLNLHMLASNTPVSQNLLLNILKRAEKEVGFITTGHKLLIEAFSSQDGILIFTITKFKQDNILGTNKNSKIKFKRKLANSSLNNAIYVFDNFDNFCELCSYIDSNNFSNLKDFSNNISLYEYNQKYYLVISDINTNFEHSNFFYASISEFAKFVSNSSILENKLIEHGNLIIKKNAIKKRNKIFFKKIMKKWKCGNGDGSLFHFH